MFTHNFKRLTCLFALFYLLLPLGASASPRDVVDHVATLIENNYFAADKAANIAGNLRDAAGAGRFDRWRDPGDLAARGEGQLVGLIRALAHRGGHLVHRSRGFLQAGSLLLSALTEIFIARFDFTRAPGHFSGGIPEAVQSAA